MCSLPVRKINNNEDNDDGEGNNNNNMQISGLSTAKKFLQDKEFQEYQDIFQDKL